MINNSNDNNKMTFKFDHHFISVWLWWWWWWWSAKQNKMKIFFSDSIFHHIINWFFWSSTFWLWTIEADWRDNHYIKQKTIKGNKNETKTFCIVIYIDIIIIIIIKKRYCSRWQWTIIFFFSSLSKRAREREWKPWNKWKKTNRFHSM